MLTVINIGVSRRNLKVMKEEQEVSTYLLVNSADSMRADNRMFRMFPNPQKTSFSFH